MPTHDIDLSITLQNFNEGLSPLSHIDSETFIGNPGQASQMVADVVSKPGFLTQSPNLDEIGPVTELIQHISDQPTAPNETYGIGTGNLFKITPASIQPVQAINGMVEGESVIRVKENLFGFYNKSTSGEILAMPLASGVVNQSWGSTQSSFTLEKAPHPSAVKEDIMLFGNGRYLGLYVEGLGTIDPRKLDFGNDSVVADVVFNSNQWYIAVNSGSGKRSRIYTYDASGISNILNDEVGVGDQEIGFLFVHNGITYVAYDDKTNDGYAIGWIAGRQIKPLRYFKGSLPDHRQKALYKNTIIFSSGANIMSCGSSVEQLPLQISTLCGAGYAMVGAVSSPFGVPIVASTDGINFEVSQFSGFSTDSTWESMNLDTTNNRSLSRINTIIVQTKLLADNASCSMVVTANQSSKTSQSHQITGVGKTRHLFRNIDLANIEDLKITLDWSGGDSVNDCPIRKIIILGNFTER